MAKYRAAYKCPICGTMVCIGNPVEIPYNELPKLLGEVVRNQQFAGNSCLYQAPIHTVHKCSDGNAGLAQFAGFMVVE